jgi:ATP-dependent exoDNAse (exonuclease V) beta subunit
MTDILCVLYVAMTRARYRLDVILEHHKDGKKAKALRRPGAILRNALLTGEEAPEEDGVLWSHESSSKEWCEGGDGKAPEEVQDCPAFKLAPTAGLRRLPRRAPSSMGEVEIRDAALLLRSHSKSAQHGTLVHALMEGVEWLEAHERTAEDLRVALHVHGASDADAESAIAAFSTTLEQPEVQALLAREAQEVPDGSELVVSNERDFSLVLTDEEGAEYFANGSIDRLVLTLEDGVPKSAEVIDYKTDRIQPEEVEAGAEHHAPQMQAYRRAVSAMYGLAPEDVALKLAFLTPGVVHELN